MPTAVAFKRKDVLKTALRPSVVTAGDSIRPTQATAGKGVMPLAR